jgi:Zn-dependent protease with chaperone function
MQALLRFVQKVALERNLPLPDLVRFHAESVAHVYIDAQGEKVLVLGGLALRCLSQNALSGIVAHELGHFAAGDTELSRRCHGRRLLMRLLESNLVLLVKPQGPVWFGRVGVQMNPLFWILMNLLNPVPWVIVGYHRLFELIYAAHSRQQEFAADRFSAEQCGNAVAAETLIFMETIERVPGVKISGIAHFYLATNTPLSRIFSEQAASARRIDPTEWETACGKALSARTHWFDSHPCLTERLARLDMSWKKAKKFKPDQSGPPAATLIDDWDTLESRLTGHLMARFQQQFQWKQDMQQIEKHLASKSKKV